MPGTPKHHEELLRELRSKDSEQRKNAILGIGFSKVKQAIPNLIDILKNDEDPAVRRRAANAFTYMPDARAVPQLLDTFQNDKDNSVRAKAASVLSFIKMDDSTRSNVVKVLFDHISEENSTIRKEIVGSLGKLADPSIAPDILNILRTDPVPEVRGSAAWALGEMEYKSAVPDLLDRFKNDEGIVKADAADSLHKIGDPSIFDPIVEILNSNEDIDSKTSAMYVLSGIDNSHSFDILANILKNDNDVVMRVNAAGYLRHLSDERVVDTLMNVLTSHFPEPSPEEKFHKIPAELLANIQEFDPSSLKLLRKDEAGSIRRAVGDSLWMIGGPVITSKLLDVLKNHEDSNVRIVAASTIGRMRSEEAVPDLIDHWMNDPSWPVQHASIEALGSIGGEAAFDHLVDALGDSQIEIHAIAPHVADYAKSLEELDALENHLRSKNIPHDRMQEFLRYSNFLRKQLERKAEEK